MHSKLIPMHLKTLTAEDLGLPDTVRIMSVCLLEDQLIRVHFHDKKVLMVMSSLLSIFRSAWDALFPLVFDSPVECSCVRENKINTEEMVHGKDFCFPKRER